MPDEVTPFVRAGTLTDEPTGTLHEHPRNPRHGDVPAVIEAIATNGYIVPVIAQRSTRTVIDGNHRLQAARQLGMATIPVVWVDVDDDTALRHLLAANRLNDRAAYDDQGLVALLTELAQSTELALAGTGYDGDALDQMIADLAALEASQPSGEDAGPTEVPVVPVTQPGDLWVLGEHRLLCGDARDADAYQILLTGEAVGCVVTDPPYGVAIGDKNAALNSIGRGNTHEGPLDGDQGMGDAEALWRAAFPVIRAQLTPGTGYYVFGPQGGGLGELLLLLLRESGMEARHLLIWVKDRPTFSLGRLDYEYQHEPICYGWVPGAAHRWHADSPQSSVIQCDRPAASKLHPTMKPVEVIVPLIRNSTAVNEIVLDPFAGSGTTLVAAENLGRRARLIEIDGGYVDVCVKRWLALTGGDAIRESDGAKWSELALLSTADRAP